MAPMFDEESNPAHPVSKGTELWEGWPNLEPEDVKSIKLLSLSLFLSRRHGKMQTTFLSILFA